MYLESRVSLSFSILSLLLTNGPQALYINAGCPKPISPMNLSPANKNDCSYYRFHIFKKISPSTGIPI